MLVISFFRPFQPLKIPEDWFLYLNGLTTLFYSEKIESILHFYTLLFRSTIIISSPLYLDFPYSPFLQGFESVREWLKKFYSSWENQWESGRVTERVIVMRWASHLDIERIQRRDIANLHECIRILNCKIFVE